MWIKIYWILWNTKICLAASQALMAHISCVHIYKLGLFKIMFIQSFRLSAIIATSSENFYASMFALISYNSHACYRTNTSFCLWFYHNNTLWSIQRGFQIKENLLPKESAFLEKAAFQNTKCKMWNNWIRNWSDTSNSVRSE